MGIAYYHSLPVFKRYFRPESVAEAVPYLSQYNGEARILAGGTDLLVLMRARKLKPGCIIDIKGMREADRIGIANGKLKIGALATLRKVELAEIVRHGWPLLNEAISQMASIQIRNMATVVGNICRASPSGDTLPPLLILEATVDIAYPGGSRSVALQDFLTAPGETGLKTSEMVTGIQIPLLPEKAATAFFRITRVAADLAKVNAAAMVVQKENECLEARIALGGVSPTAFRAREAESYLKGKTMDTRVIEKAAGLAASESHPISDVRSSEEYRREICRVLVSRAIKTCLARNQGGGKDTV